MSEDPVFIREETSNELGFVLTVEPDVVNATDLGSNDSSHEVLPVEPTAEEQRVTYARWLTEQDINLKDVPHLTMGLREKAIPSTIYMPHQFAFWIENHLYNIIRQRSTSWSVFIFPNRLRTPPSVYSLPTHLLLRLLM